MRREKHTDLKKTHELLQTRIEKKHNDRDNGLRRTEPGPSSDRYFFLVNENLLPKTLRKKEDMLPKGSKINHSKQIPS